MSTLSYSIWAYFYILTLFYALIDYNLNVEYFSPYKITFFTVKMERKATCLLAFGSELGSPFNLTTCFLPHLAQCLLVIPPPYKKESTILTIFCTWVVAFCTKRLYQIHDKVWIVMQIVLDKIKINKQSCYKRWSEHYISWGLCRIVLMSSSAQ